VSATVIAPAPVTVGEARAALGMAVAVPWPQGIRARQEIFSAVLTLGCSLKRYRGLGAGEEAAGPVAHAGGRLIEVMTRNCGPEWGNER
jgi:hypothetical protein